MFDRGDEDIVVSTEHVKLRTVLFVLAFLLAVGSFTWGFLRLGHKDPGLYEIEVNPDPENTLYDKGFHLYYNFEGSSNEIKQKQNQLRDFYSISLARIVKELDSENEYESIVSLAYLNNHPGETVEVSEELACVLRDAQEKENRCYSLFNGPLYALWKDILYLDRPQDSDPLNDEGVRQRIESFTELLENQKPELVIDGLKVRFVPSASYLEFMEETEMPDCYMDLNLLHDAYVLKLAAEDLKANGYTDGYLESDSGAVVLLGDYEADRIEFCGAEIGSGALVPKAVFRPGKNIALSRFKIVSSGETGYYRITDSGTDVYRHPYYLKDGYPQEKYAVSYVIDVHNDPVNAVYQNIVLQEEFTGEMPDCAVFCQEKTRPDAFLTNVEDRLEILDPAAEFGELRND